MSNGTRRIFYDNLTGERIIEIGRESGFVIPTIERDIESETRLSERNRGTFDVLELPFGAFAQDFTECGGYRVNPVTKELEFAPKPTTPEEPLVFGKPFSEQILQLKESQVATNRAIADNTTAQQDLLELLIDMGVI